MFDVLAPQKM